MVQLETYSVKRIRPGRPHTRLIHMHNFVAIGLHGSDNKITNKWQMAGHPHKRTHSGSINIHIVHHLEYTLATRSAYIQTSYMHASARSRLLRPGPAEQQLSWKHPQFSIRFFRTIIPFGFKHFPFKCFISLLALVSSWKNRHSFS